MSTIFPCIYNSNFMNYFRGNASKLPYICCLTKMGPIWPLLNCHFSGVFQLQDQGAARSILFKISWAQRGVKTRESMATNHPPGPIGMVFRVTILPFWKGPKKHDHLFPNLFDKHHFFQQIILCLLDTIGIYSRKNTPPKISIEPKVMC